MTHLITSRPNQEFIGPSSSKSTIFPSKSPEIVIFQITKTSMLVYLYPRNRTRRRTLPELSPWSWWYLTQNCWYWTKRLLEPISYRQRPKSDAHPKHTSSCIELAQNRNLRKTPRAKNLPGIHIQWCFVNETILLICDERKTQPTSEAHRIGPFLFSI